MNPLLARGLLPRIEEALRTVPVVILEGPRASGKTSIGVLLAAAGHVQQSVDLSDPTTRLASRYSPTEFVDGLTTPAMIDEAHLEPDLLLAVKRRVDRDRRPGQFLLTGSSRLGRSQLGGSDPLAGRAIRLRVWPMTQGELAGSPVQLVEQLLTPSGSNQYTGPTLSKSDLLTRIGRGGLPTLSGTGDEPTPAGLRPQLMAEYVEAVLHHDTHGRHDRAELLRVFRYLASTTSRLLNTANVANELSTTRETIGSRIAMLDGLFLIHPLLAHRSGEHRAIAAHPKLHAVDVGIAAWASRLTGEPSAAIFGSLVETFVVNELCAQSSWARPGIQIRHWRDTTKKLEVDAVLIDDNTGESVAVEVKASVDIRADDLRGLKQYLKATPRAVAGYVFYTGATSLQLDENIWAIPIQTLWAATSS